MKYKHSKLSSFIFTLSNIKIHAHYVYRSHFLKYFLMGLLALILRFGSSEGEAFIAMVT